MRRGVCVVLLYFGLAVAAHAQALEEPAVLEAAAPLEPVAFDPIDRLNAPDWAQRQDAYEALLADRQIDVDRLVGAYRAAEAQPEVQIRLMQVIRHRLIARMVESFPELPEELADLANALPQPPRNAIEPNDAVDPAAAASLGFRHGLSGRNFNPDPLPDRPGPEVFVVDTLPGFPAYATLRPGDIIVAFAGQPLPPAGPPNEPSPIIQAIQRQIPGDTVAVRVVRDGREVGLNVRLASLAALRAMYVSLRDETSVLSPRYQLALDRQLDRVFDRPLTNP